MVEQPLLRLDNIVKTFPGITANDHINLEVKAGEVHCLLGENGAGKSVLMSVLYGMYPADSGQVYYKGQPLQIRSPKDAIAHHIGMVHQHFMLVPTLTVAENIVLGQHRPWRVLYDMDKVATRIRALSAELHMDVDPKALIANLSVGEQQRVEILKAMYHGADLLILDEPTAVLTPQETTQLLTLLRELAGRGMTIIFITHKLEEVMQASDRVTVLRDGKLVATVSTRDTNARQLARMMVGRDVLMDLPRRPAQPGDPVLTVRDLTVKNERGLAAVRDVDLEVRSGEIVAVAGVSGNGQTELALAISGLLAPLAGEIAICGERVALSPRSLAEAGLAHIPEDRIKMGIVPPFSVCENFILHQYRDEPYSHRGFLSFRSITEHAWELVQKFDVRTNDVDKEIGQLSGGNQQKVVVARELFRHPRFLLVNQPTRGIDIGATEFVLQQILAQRDAGAGILLISTELEEIFAVADQILVMYEGQIAGRVPADRSRLEEVGLMMAGKTA
ncbi:MAG TPA: ABC transporter ATP-binding protein [Anaerolineae bacterium]